VSEKHGAREERAKGGILKELEKTNTGQEIEGFHQGPAKEDVFKRHPPEPRQVQHVRDERGLRSRRKFNKKAVRMSRKMATLGWLGPVTKSGLQNNRSERHVGEIYDGFFWPKRRSGIIEMGKRCQGRLVDPTYL